MNDCEFVCRRAVGGDLVEADHGSGGIRSVGMIIGYVFTGKPRNGTASVEGRSVTIVWSFAMPARGPQLTSINADPSQVSLGSRAPVAIRHLFRQFRGAGLQDK